MLNTINEKTNMRFTESTYYVMKDSKVYRNVKAGLIEEKWSITRKVGKLKIHAEHFNCALPYTVYYILDFENQKIYKSEEYHYSCLDELVEKLKEV